MGKIFVYCFCLIGVSNYVQATPVAEIEHLLLFVASTDCTYERNGTLHNGNEAVKHIRKKYNYYHDDIVSAEDFITYSATKSKLSGIDYVVYCQDQKAIKSSEWLLRELAVFRERK